MTDPSAPPRDFPALSLDHTLRFDCVPGSCDLRCCTTGHPLVLNPYEILRISRATGIPYDKLEDDHFEESYDPATGFPLVTINRERGCPFLVDRSCSIYHDRPLVCRLFPLGKLHDDGFRYVLLSENPCIGFFQPKESPVRDFLISQETAHLDRIWETWADFVGRAEEAGMVDESLFRAVLRMLIYNTDLPPAGRTIEEIESVDEAEILKLRLEGALGALPRLKAIFESRTGRQHTGNE